jgi:hypothetical protein
MGISALPQIGNLPPALAVRRADEFTRFVEPVLQFSCARCHNEQFDGTFRLVRYRHKRDQTVDARRANLDAVLAFVDLENPAKSELLSSTLRRHGNGENARPIFVGSNDRQYQVLATWVNSLKTKSATGVVATGRFAPSEPPSRFQGAEPAADPGFATQRVSQLPMPLTPTPPSGASPAAPSEVTPLPAGQFLPGSASGGQSYAPPSTEFPAPYLVGGPRPKLPPAPAGTIPPPVPAGAPGSLPPMPAAPAADAAATKKPRKPIALDPALLEKALMNRYQQP